MIYYTIKLPNGLYIRFSTREEAEEFNKQLEKPMLIIERRTNDDTHKPETYT